jgi:DinB family protein
LAHVFTVDRAAREHAEAQSALAWAIQLIPADLAARTPRSGGWSVAANLAHLVVYEERIAVPVLEAAVRREDGAGSVPSGDEDWLARDSETLAKDPFREIVARYRASALRHAELLTSFDDASFNVPWCSLWSEPLDGALVSAGWVAKKSLQHTWEHGHTVIRAGWLAAVQR